MRREQGITTVEFAIVGAAALLVLFTCIEIARALFVWNTIGEATRRGARVAVVSTIDDADVVAAVLAYGAYVPGLAVGNVSVSYRNAAWVETADEGEVAFVSVSISEYEHTLLIPQLFPGFTTTVPMPPFTTTLPAESMGFEPDEA